MTTWQITIKCILCCSMRSQMRWKKSKNRISVMPKTSSSPPNKRQKNSISQQRTKKAAVPRATSAAMPPRPPHHLSKGGERSNAAIPLAVVSSNQYHLPSGGERSNAADAQAVRRQTPVTRALRSARGCTMNRHAEDSWRSHVHRTYTAQRVQSFKLPARNVRGRGGSPLVFLSGDLKGDTLFEKRVSPFVWQQRKELH